MPGSHISKVMSTNHLGELGEGQIVTQVGNSFSVGFFNHGEIAAVSGNMLLTSLFTCEHEVEGGNCAPGSSPAHAF